ncbi:MAG: P1 family peptidase [Williamsia herbipolensis]|nr:P1 family peptidase [Williamsia herbipolensis]
MPVSGIGSITDVAGMRVGHAHRVDDDATVATPEAPGSGWATGVTVVTLPEGSVAAVDVRGGGPGTRETDLLDPVNSVQTAHAIVLTGGSAYGLAAADGVMAGLEEAGVGLRMDDRGGVVPIVPGSVVFDLPVGGWRNRPDAAMGAAALAAAGTAVGRGSVGAGTGARAGVLKGGVGTASTTADLGDGVAVTVAAIMVANPVGDVLDPGTGLPWYASADEMAVHGLTAPSAAQIAALRELREKATVLNTTIGVVATDARLDPAATRRVAMAAHDGMAHAIRPAHSPLDGDTVFAVATGAVEPPAHPDVPDGMHPAVPSIARIGAAAAVVTRRAIVDAVLSATGVAGIPAHRDVLAPASHG